MRILLDATALEDSLTGVSRYAIELMRELFQLDSDNHYTVLVRKSLSEGNPVYTLASQHPQVAIIARNVPAIGLKRELAFLAVPRGFDVYHCLHSNLPLTRSRRAIVTIHDLKYVLYPHYLGRLWRLKTAYLRALFGHAARRAAAVITVSEATKQDFLRLFGTHRVGAVTTIHEASDVGRGAAGSAWGGQDDPGGERYFLYVGELRPHKNVDGLIRGFAWFLEARTRTEPISLYIGGKAHASFTQPPETPESVRWLGYVTDEELPSLYRNALGFCLVSHYEGFGLPILEAMSYGTPVITSNLSSMPEIAGDAALMVDPCDPLDIAAAMKRVEEDDEARAALARAGKERVREFSWRKCAEETLAVYESVAAVK